MQENWTFEIGEEPLRNEMEIDDFLTSRKKELGIFLSFYYKKNGAVAENVSVINTLLLDDKKSGNLTLSFDVVYFNACLAIHEQEQDKMSLKFKLDRENRKLDLIGPNWPEREMDDI